MEDKFIASKINVDLGSLDMFLESPQHALDAAAAKTKQKMINR